MFFLNIDELNEETINCHKSFKLRNAIKKMLVQTMF